MPENNPENLFQTAIKIRKYIAVNLEAFVSLKERIHFAVNLSNCPSQLTQFNLWFLFPFEQQVLLGRDCFPDVNSFFYR